MKRHSISILILLSALIFFGCDINNPISDITYSLDEQSYEQPAAALPAVTDADTAAAAYVYNDPVSRTAVFVDSSGIAIPIQSDEKAGVISCTEVTDFLLFNDEPALSRSAGFTRNHAKAFILGKRSDGYAGLWVIYTDGRVRPVINGDGFDTSKLLEMVEGRQPLSAYFNWDYKAVDMISNDDESEIIIIGYAENSGVSRHNYTIEEGTTIGVYWAVTLDENGYYHISRARVIGYRDFHSRINLYKQYIKSRFRHHHRWMWSLRTFFAGWYDYYLVMTESIEAGDNAGEYRIYGTDQDGEDSVAVVTARNVLSIEKYEAEDPGEDPGTGTVSNVLLFSSDRDGDFEIFGLDLDTDTLSQLTFNNSTDKHPALSADGSRIAFVSDRSGSWGIYTMDPDGNNVSGMLAPLSGAAYGHPSWSPDGTMIAFDNGYEIYTVGSDGTGQANLTNTVFTNEKEPEWSPDGTLIVYSSSADGDYDIYTMPADGSGSPVKLTNNTVVDESPSWSPDGSRIAYSTNIDANYEVYSMGSDGINPVNLTVSVENEKYPSWSANGIAFLKSGDIYSLVPGSSEPAVNLTSDSAVDQDPSW